MADVDDQEKAEKLAAAKKRFEELKKKQQKGKKAGTKKKEEKSEDATTKAENNADVKNEEEIKQDGSGEAADEADEAEDDAGKPVPTRNPSVTLQSRQRSESFRKGSASSGGHKSPSLPTVDSEAEVQELYRKQAARIEDLEKQVETLSLAETKLKKTEEELEQLREGSDDVAALKSKAAQSNEQAAELEKLKTELNSTQRQLTQAQQAASNRRKSSAGVPSDLTAQLASKTSTIESLELELSNLKYQNSILETDKSSYEANVKSLEQRATAAEDRSTSLQAEIEKLKETLSSPTDAKPADAEADPEALQRKVSVLESSLRTAQAAADAVTNRATNLESKIETLTKLHRESSTQNAVREKEVKDLKARVKAATQARNDAAGEDLSDLEVEEREKLNSRIRDLEAENFELRRGVWRDKRAALQPGMDDGGLDSAGSGTYEDVDLNGSGSNPYGGRPSFGAGRQSSTFSDVLQSGISAFTGRDNPRVARGSEGAAARGRKQSLGLLSEDGFDEDAFRNAQEEEAKTRIERIREVKRGLEQWRGWRLDLVDQRAAGLPGLTTGPVFDI
ncbi:hypothetical protein KVT40_004039 [Elsinoe batatas]|uniref:M protein repeat protein n=1 Tax=Elsinoe batatas TaxID=2601811 RepID=A0A8K0L1I9_9PEZI|nr:hypothetical protein KVT40_004039 [Elsinoe batatas]